MLIQSKHLKPFISLCDLIIYFFFFYNSSSPLVVVVCLSTNFVSTMASYVQQRLHYIIQLVGIIGTIQSVKVVTFKNLCMLIIDYFI